MDWEFLDATDGYQYQPSVKEYNSKKVQKLQGYQITSAEIGCFVSHRRAWELCVLEHRPTLILEDDFVLLSTFMDALQLIFSSKTPWEALRIQGLQGTGHSVIENMGNFDIVKNNADPIGLAAYILKPEGAKKLITNAQEIYEPVDHYFEHLKKHHLVVYALKPYIVEVSLAPSTIDDRPDRKPVKGFKKTLRSIARQLDRMTSPQPWYPK
ncbi:lipooligosaccharide biosynthesis protein LpsA [Polynucleobacter sp. SHI8]|nr:lipooligosaccharide biosynthesis protein LpsA [Polynucleobacter sp. SHI2]BDW12665.1 lipooligosaccharide biosynthesis protein LpsA [Polynucleobacter sp. SHI8]